MGAEFGCVVIGLGSGASKTGFAFWEAPSAVVPGDCDLTWNSTAASQGRPSLMGLPHPAASPILI